LSDQDAQDTNRVIQRDIITRLEWNTTMAYRKSQQAVNPYWPIGVIAMDGTVMNAIDSRIPQHMLR
jgi:hypothetical protein